MSEALIEQFKKDFPHFSPLWISVNQKTIIEAGLCCTNLSVKGFSAI